MCGRVFISKLKVLFLATKRVVCYIGNCWDQILQENYFWKERLICKEVEHRRQSLPCRKGFWCGVLVMFLVPFLIRSWSFSKCNIVTCSMVLTVEVSLKIYTLCQYKTKQNKKARNTINDYYRLSGKINNSFRQGQSVYFSLRASWATPATEQFLWIVETITLLHPAV